jgi:predicted transcriptional regulator
MILDKVGGLDARMPAFVVPEKVRNEIDRISSVTGLSRGEIMRRALTLFLDAAANQINKIDNEVNNQEQTA